MRHRRVAIVGRANVGKSSLFNRLVGKRKAIVYDRPGVTIDHINAPAKDCSFTCIDTVGYPSDMPALVCDLFIVLFDGQVGVQKGDAALVRHFRQEKQVIYAVNKIDKDKNQHLLAAFYKLGIDDKLMSISALRGIGISALVTKIESLLNCSGSSVLAQQHVHVALVGRQNAGKSLLLNKIAHAQVACVSEKAGTTRDSIDLPYRFANHSYMLTDTAGLRRKIHQVKDKVEFLSMTRTLNAVREAQIVVMVIDSTKGITQQDMKIISLSLSQFKPILVVLNKWDLVDKSQVTYDSLCKYIRSHVLPWANYLPIVLASALNNFRVSDIKKYIASLSSNFQKRVSTGKLNRVFIDITSRHPPRLYNGRRVNFYYITQAETQPPTFVVKCNYPEQVESTYQRYLTASLRRELGFMYVPLKLLYRR